MPYLILIAFFFCALSTAINIKLEAESNRFKRQTIQNLRNECLEYQHTQDDQVICIKGLSEEQINQILDR